MYKKIDGYLYKTGKIKLELEVMTKPQALQRPAGFGRSDPNENPEIDEPMWDFFNLAILSFTFPFRMLFTSDWLVYCLEITC